MLVTGFLGSGKTTLLREWAATRTDLRMMFLVNDLSESGVDAERLRRDRPDTHSVVGGSIFCECKAADFLRMLKEDVLPAHAEDSLDLLVIETSGIADPMAIGTLIDQSGHADDLEVRGVMTVISPNKFLRSAGRLPVVDAQIRAADTVVLNKTDTADEEQLQACEKIVTELNPDARLLRTRYGKGISLDPSARQLPLPGEPLGKCSALAFTSVNVMPGFFPSRAFLQQKLEALPDSILRIKGTVWTPEGAMDIDVTPDTTSITPAASPGERSELDIIGAKESLHELERVAKGFRARTGLIACDVFQEELEAAEGLPEVAELVWLPMGLHDRPLELKEKVQAEIDRLESECGVTEILLLYGLCGTGTAGLKSSRVPMVLPRAHDCIAFLLGSNQRHRDLQSACAGTYFYAPGWIRERRVPGPDRERWIREEYAGRFDDEMIEELIEADAEAFGHYSKALYIRTPAGDTQEVYCKRCAEHLKWDFEAVRSDPTWFRSFFLGPWPEESFLLVPPGGVVETSADDRIIRLAARSDT
jgi:G3E family GTPase